MLRSLGGARGMIDRQGAGAVPARRRRVRVRMGVRMVGPVFVFVLVRMRVGAVVVAVLEARVQIARRGNCVIVAPGGGLIWRIVRDEQALAVVAPPVVQIKILL